MSNINLNPRNITLYNKNSRKEIEIFFDEIIKKCNLDVCYLKSPCGILSLEARRQCLLECNLVPKKIIFSFLITETDNNKWYEIIYHAWIDEFWKLNKENFKNTMLSSDYIIKKEKELYLKYYPKSKLSYDEWKEKLMKSEWRKDK